MGERLGVLFKVTMLTSVEWEHFSGLAQEEEMRAAAFEWHALCKMTRSDGTQHSPSCKTAAAKRMHVYVPVDMK